MSNQYSQEVNEMIKVNGEVYVRTRFGLMKGVVDDIQFGTQVIVTTLGGSIIETELENIIPIIPEQKYAIEETYDEEKDEYDMVGLGVFDASISKYPFPSDQEPTEENIHKHELHVLELASKKLGYKLTLKTGKEILRDHFKK
ncbi:hypothetical protein P9X10_01085 [Bacillus cereus]|nr:hypothetical protein [Bacillus cereus]